MSNRNNRNLGLESIRNNWRHIPLSDVLNVQGGYAFKSKDATEKGVRWLKIANVGIGEINWREQSFLPSDYLDEYIRYALKENDIVMAMTRPVIRNSVKVARISQDDIPTLLNQRVARFNFNDEYILGDYFYQVARSPYFAEEIQLKIAGTDPPNISSQQIESILIHLPPLNEQKKITAILSNVEEAIKKTEAVIEQTEKVKKGLMQQLFTKGIGHKDYKQTVIGEIPRKWDIYPLRDLIIGGSQNGLYKPKEYYGSGFGMVHMREMFKGEVLDISALQMVNTSVGENEKFSLNEGDILFARRSVVYEGAGTPVYVPKHTEPITFESSIIRITPNQDFILPMFLNLYFRSPVGRVNMQRIIRRLAVSGISSEDLLGLYVPVPSLDEQKQIVNSLAGVSKRKEIEEKKISSLTKVKQGLMQSLLTGKVRVKVDEDEVTQV
ncbi:restriction endonuclease subunit S [Bacillus cereus]|uniref:restriction endonuclease subunit S n=1 Tax=Bacillus cereus group TaxID=86661 RepID=UPI0002D41F6E|nr:restriction endonuclease subunit S [Bacillus cereus]HDR4563360.1 restriction endonuclease subunit S [Bacillus luti]